MEMSSSSRNSSRTTSNYPGPKCYCGLPAKLMKSKTERNPNRRFFGCELYKQGGTTHCKFFRWIDEEEKTVWPKRGLIEGEEEIDKKEKRIEQLTTTIYELQTDLEKIEGEIEKKKTAEIELKKKLDDMENVLCRQRIIIVGLSGVILCGIGLFHCRFV